MSAYHEEQIAALRSELQGERKGNGKLYQQLKDQAKRIAELQAEVTRLKAQLEGPRVEWSGHVA